MEDAPVLCPVAEVNVLETDFGAIEFKFLSRGQRLGLHRAKRGCIGRVVDALLETSNAVAEIPKIAAHQNEGCDRESDIARGGVSLNPGMYHQTRYAGLHR
ncbi:hypothetical protein D3C87_1929630 [compost metagenome]